MGWRSRGRRRSADRWRTDRPYNEAVINLASLVLNGVADDRGDGDDEHWAMSADRRRLTFGASGIADVHGRVAAGVCRRGAGDDTARST